MKIVPPGEKPAPNSYRVVPDRLAAGEYPSARPSRHQEAVEKVTTLLDAGIDHFILVGALNGVDKAVLLSDRYCPVEDYWRRNPLAERIDAVAAGSFKDKEPPEIKGEGYVVRSLEAALWAFHRSTGFRDGALLAVNLGDDADTTGAIYGQIAGAHYGIEAIPVEWRQRLTMKAEIESLADRLHDGRSSGLHIEVETSAVHIVIERADTRAPEHGILLPGMGTESGSTAGRRPEPSRLRRLPAHGWNGALRGPVADGCRPRRYESLDANVR